MGDENRTTEPFPYLDALWDNSVNKLNKIQKIKETVLRWKRIIQ